MPFYLTLLHEAMLAELRAIAPLILLLLAVGLATAILQSALQIEDTGFSLLPKLLAMVAIVFSGGLGALHVFSALASFWLTHAAFWVHQSWS